MPSLEVQTVENEELAKGNERLRPRIKRNLGSYLSSKTSSTQSKDNTSDEANMTSSNWQLQLQARTWRSLAKTGFWIHSLANPKPPNPAFTKQFLSGAYGGSAPRQFIDLYFYVPEGYDPKRRKYPVVVNFHGGGFTLGSATDDRRWAGLVLRETGAVVVSVEYRLAPEFAFPIAVEDGCEALLHLAGNSQRYGIDAERMAISGFSAGANMVFTVPLKLHDYISKAKDEDNSSGIPSLKIVSLISFYPLLDFQEARASKREGCKRPDKTLAPVLTTLFDSSYMPNMDNAKSPFASPSTAPEQMLSEALPADNIGLYCCEWDMLHAEGLAFSKRLIAIGKNIEYETIPEVPHAFDKAPNPFGVDPKAEEIYQKACGVLKKAFGPELHPLPLL